MPKKEKWQAEEVMKLSGGRHYRVYGRMARSEIIVRVEKDGDTSKYAEWGMPKILGLSAAMHQGAVQTTEQDIKA